MGVINKIGIAFPFDFLHIYGGASQRLKADLSALARLGMSVEVIFPTRANRATLKQWGYKSNTALKTYPNLQKIPFLPEKTRLLFDEYGQVFNPFYYMALRKDFRNSDLLFAHLPITFVASHLALGKKLPVLYIALNFEYGTLKQTTRNPLVHKIIYYAEKYACLKASRVLCVSEEDKRNIQNTYNLPSDKIVVFPNVVDVDFFSQTRILFDKILERQKLGINPESFVLIFSGRMDYRPNIEALKFIMNELITAMEQINQDFKLLIVGAQIPAWFLNFKRQMVSVHPNVPDIRRFYAIADAAIVPLSTGGGTRIKILEAFAVKLPVISTEIGYEGIDCQNGKHLLLARRDAEDLIDKATVLTKNMKMRENITTNAYELVTQKYSTNAASMRLEKLIKELGCH